ncbi:sugar transferase (plasmid) [Falsihalocynthiibacter sp. SS001]|uniref:sugar transferase n=1 Tax=Falsihalocynthiibacter sp. SS001 TaxID=3349698 RepID=UPI0036D24D2D
MYVRLLKRASDVILVVAAIPFVVPLVCLFLVLVRRDGAAALFAHERVGRNGVTFRCWKIRTMVPDAESKLVEYLQAHPECAREWAANFKLKNDPRITPFGHFLRQTGLDELPQLWNVLKGEMSLVGPRPVPSAELQEKYGDQAWAYRAMRPGLTGLWQVMGRGKCTYEARIEMDMAYFNKASLFMDLKILCLTAYTVIARSGS